MHATCLQRQKRAKFLPPGFGVAGPVIRRKASGISPIFPGNLTLTILADNSASRRSLYCMNRSGSHRLFFLPWIRPEELCTHNVGTPEPQAAQALIAAGTGLGEAILFWNGSRYVVSPSEGGHCDFAPRTDREIDLLRYLKKNNPCVSWELIVSGRGFHVLHTFLNPSVRHAGLH